MAIQLNWYVEPHILSATFSGDVNVQDSVRMISQYIHLVGHKMHPVYLICDVTNLGEFEVDLNFLRNLAFEIKLHKMALIVVVGQNYAFDMFMETVARISGAGVRNVNDVDEAVTRILKDVPRLVLTLE